MVIKQLILSLVVLVITNCISNAKSTGSVQTSQILENTKGIRTHKSDKPIVFIPPPDASDPCEANDHHQHLKFINESLCSPRRDGNLINHEEADVKRRSKRLSPVLPLMIAAGLIFPSIGLGQSTTKKPDRHDPIDTDPRDLIDNLDLLELFEDHQHQQKKNEKSRSLPRKYGKLYYNASGIFVQDINGKQHLVNPDPYTVVDEHLEPAFIPETDIYFLLYTNENVRQGQVLRVSDIDSIMQSNFNPELPTRILIHGYQADENSPIEKDLRMTYLKKGYFNIICVDWSLGAKTINYYTARHRVQAVGFRTSEMIDTLGMAYGTSLASKIYVIGHSLGAHVAGNVGKHQHGEINTIFGLDPAGPLFRAYHLDALNKEDAKYVETINTNTRLGIFEPLGYKNFYPNGGRWQPGCGFGDYISGICSHSRAVTYFIESIANRLSFQGIKCPSFEHLRGNRCNFHLLNTIWMGGEPSNHDKKSEGIYVVLTNSKEPFGRGLG